MEEVYVVRKRAAEGTPIRRIARDMGSSKNRVKRYMRGAEPVGKPRGVVGSPVHDAVEPRIAEILADSKRWMSGKQRLTARPRPSLTCCLSSATLPLRMPRQGNPPAPLPHRRSRAATRVARIASWTNPNRSSRWLHDFANIRRIGEALRCFARAN